MQVKSGESKRNYLVTLAITIVGVLILNSSFYWPQGELRERRIIMYILMAVGLVCVPILVVKISFLNEFCSYVIEQVKRLWNFVRQNWKNILKYAVVFAVTAGIAYGVEFLVGKVFEEPFNPHHFYWILTILYIALAVFFMRKNVGAKPENLFLVIVLLLGTLMIKTVPPIVGVCWDDETHYARTLNLANVFNGITYESDEIILRDLEPNVYGHLYYDRESQAEYIAKLEQAYASDEHGRVGYGHVGIWSVAYMHSAVGILIGRGLGLSYVHMFQLGKFFNLLLYAFVFYFAIKRLKYGKVLVASIGLIPTSVFMAGSYAYDGWVIGFTVLGFAYFLEAIQNPERVLTRKDMVIMTGSLFLGCVPKAIYFPLLFPLLFLPKKKFVDKKDRKFFFALVIGAMFLLAASFLLPMLIFGPGTGDLRGGEGVNSTEQVHFILGNPFQYARILIHFLGSYLAIENSAWYLQYYGYLGLGEYFGISIVLLFVLAFVDKGAQKEKNTYIRWSMVLALLAVIVLVPTALYISFTPVAHETVLGCQYRYLIPILFPALYFLGQDGVTTKWNKNAFAIIPMLIMAATFLYNLDALGIALY